MLRCLLFILLLGACPARADFGEQLALDGARDAEAAVAKARTLLQKPLEQNPEQWIPAWIYLWEADEVKPEWKTPEVLQRMIHLARERQKTAWLLLLEYAQNPSDKQTIVDKAAAADEFRIVAQILTHQARDAYNSGQVKDSLLLIQKAAKTLEKRVPRDDLQHLNVQSNMAIYLEFSGAVKQAEGLYLDLIQQCRRHGWLYNRAEIQVGYALLLMHQKRYAETETLLNDTMQLALALKSDLLQAHTYKSLGYARAGQQHHAAAIEAYENAILISSRIEIDPVGVADTHRLLAAAYSSNKQWDKALKELERAAAVMPLLQDKYWENEVQETRMNAYAGMGRLSEALTASKRINQLLREILEEEKQKELSKLKVSMGLEIEEQKNANLKQQNAVQEDKLREADLVRRFFLGLTGLGCAVILLLLFALRQTLRAKRSRERTHRILQHIEEGILSIGAGLRVQDDFSPYLKRLLDASAEHENIFVNLLQSSTLSADERATILSLLQACIGESPLSWELNGPQLPREILLHQGDRHLLLDWQPVFHDKQTIDSILLTVRDISDQKRLQIEMEAVKAQHHRQEQRLGLVLRLQATGARKFANEAQQILGSIQTNWSDGPQKHLVAQQLHTLKGMARALGFKDMSTLVHELEDALGAAGSLDSLQAMLQDYVNLIHKVFPGESLNTRQALIDCVAPQLPSVRAALEQAGLELGRIAVIDELDAWPAEWLATAQIFCLHGLMNSAEHGFILPQRRGETVQKAMRIHLCARIRDQQMELELQDNGRGLDWDRLQALAARVDFKPGPHQTLADVVFLDGASTAGTLSERSGRGVGMNSVRQAVEKAQGRLQLLPNAEGQGCRLVATFPLPVAKALQAS